MFQIPDQELLALRQLGSKVVAAGTIRAASHVLPAGKMVG